MIDLNKIIDISTKRLNEDVVKQQKSTKFSKFYSSRYLPFSARLINACKSQTDSPQGLDDIAFICNPERLLAKISYMSIGDVRKKKASKNKNNTEFSEEEFGFLEMCASLNDETEFSNLKNETDFNQVERVLLAHGLSPTTDTLALLLDIGRSYRFSEAYQLPIDVLLADISWMSSNRSIRQFESLTDKDIDEGLRICLDKRQRLYDALDINAVIKKIIGYEKNDTINSKKLQTISNYYISLSRSLWGDRTEGRLNIDMVKIISKSLQSIEHLDNIDQTDIPSHIKTFAQFPGVLQKIEESLEEHIEILRSVAKHFNSFDEEIFTYFFAQYYAQKEFRSNHIKIGAYSETKFDKPFDDLDKYFSTWGEGSSTADLISSGIKKISSDKKLNAIYLPQYQIGNFKVLPYNSLSLDVLKVEEKNHEIINNELICIDIDQSRETISSILKRTPLLSRNRILADITSFLQLVLKTTDKEFVTQIFKDKTDKSLEEIFSGMDKDLELIFNQEINAINEKELHLLWKTWFTKIEDTTNVEFAYMPLHIKMLFFQQFDWEKEEMISSVIDLIIGVIQIYKDLIK